MRGWLGACHGLEIGFAFGTQGRPETALFTGKGPEADRLSEHLQETGRVGRTVSTKLRYTDFSIRTRSTSLRVGIDEAAKIGELACALLDRALADRPGALRLVGVGISGLTSHQQLALV